MVAASPRVYVLEELLSFLDGDPLLKNPHWALSVQLFVVVVDEVGLGSSSNTTCLSGLLEAPLKS